MKIYDCFTFFNELDVLEMRLNILDKHVDNFILVESTQTHSGKNKDLVFKNNIDRFKKFSEKITHIVVDDMPIQENENRWILENFQRNAIMRGLTRCDDEDIILISDLDEIPNPDTFGQVNALLTKKSDNHDYFYKIVNKIKEKYDAQSIYKLVKRILHYMPTGSKKIISFKQRLYYYYLNGFINNDWIGTKAVLYKDLVKHFKATPQQIRESSAKTIINDGGWHFSYLLSPEDISKKIRSFAHSEFDKEEFTDIERIKNKINKGEDLFGRKDKITYVAIDDSYPKYITENIEVYSHYIKNE
jgi:beta-1,4-mannosyl-glycoprotein beta-1,4-N-acetylglucosaminyltransferase